MKSKREMMAGVASVLLAATAAGGYGLSRNSGSAVQRTQSAGTSFSISSPSIAGDPGGTSITETVNGMIPGDYRERLVTITPGSGLTPIIGMSVSATLNSDASPSDVAAVAQPGDALNLLQGANDTTAPNGVARAGQSGLFIEVYECSGTWSSAAGAVAAATDDRDYTCSAGGNGTIVASYDTRPTGATPTQWSLPVFATARTILIRTRIPDDATTNGRQDPLSGESITLTHRFDASSGVQATGDAEPTLHNCVIKPDGTLWCWGVNQHGELGVGYSNQYVAAITQVGTSNDWATVSSGDNHTCAIKTTGTLWCWGANYSWATQLGLGDAVDRNTPTQVGALTTWSQLSAGAVHSCATKTDGTIWCWGYNAWGQIGDATTTQRNAPVQAGVATDWANVQVGRSSTCARKTTRALWCWGYNQFGGVGDNTTTTRMSPVVVNGGVTTWDVFDVGAAHTCATRTDGTLWCWGNNNNGQLGLGDKTIRFLPNQVGVATNWNTVNAGDYHTCATKTDGTLWCVGANDVGELGQNTRITLTAPSQVGALTTWSNVSSNNTNSCATRADGTLWCWGANYYGQAGDGTALARSTPSQVGAATDWARVSVGRSVSCAIKTTGTLWCWGYNNWGEVGDGTNTIRYSPVQIGVATDWLTISMGGYHACATKTTGTLWCWGGNWAGQLGDGTNTQRLTPTQVGALTTWASASAGSTHSCAIKIDGTIWCWGYNGEGQLGDGSTTDRSSPVQTGAATTWATVAAAPAGNTTCATRANGTLWCWGRNAEGQFGNGTTSPAGSPVQTGVATNWLRVVPGGTSTCAIRTDTTLWCWGENVDGRLGLGDTIRRASPVMINGSGWTALGTGVLHACAINAGALYCWGANAWENNTYGSSTGNEYGLLANGANPDLTSFTQVGTATDWNAAYAGSYGSSCARKTPSLTLWCWGANLYGQAGVLDTSDRLLPNAVGGPDSGRASGAA